MKKILLGKNERGFTLIELLVVIAIIAVLASLSFVGLQNARRRGNDVAALGQMNAILAQAQICADAGYSISSSSTATDICTNAQKWPSLVGGWSYASSATTTVAIGGLTSHVFDGDVSNGDFKYIATTSIGGNKVIVCYEGGCGKDGF